MPKKSSEPADCSTNEIVVQILEGDLQAFRHIVRRYQADVLMIANAMMRDRDYVSDIVQKVFIKTFQNLDKFDGDQSFRLWIKGIARNTVRDELRKKYRYRGRIERYAKEMEQRLAGNGSDLFSDEARDALEDCIGRLEQDSARAIRMHYDERRKTDEIAEILGRSGGAIRVLIHRARASLRDCLVGKGVME